MRRIAVISLITLIFTIPVAGGILYIVGKTYEYIEADMLPNVVAGVTSNDKTPPFPVGVNPLKKLIVEQENIEGYLREPTLEIEDKTVVVKTSFIKKAIAKLALFDWYQNLAAGASRVLVIEPGERKEQVAQNFAKILKWSEDDKREFLVSIISIDPVLLEGKFIPGTYVVAQGAKPVEVAPLIIERFNKEVLERYPSTVESAVPLEETLTIASLLEREAYDFDDMRYISGVIWNRLFIDMNLQIDSTLQYAKGTASVSTWWPKPIPADKYIDSLYNTYQNEGLPPTPIANPSLDAILAALNPRITDCYYYFHDKKGGFHCAATYEEHVSLLKKHYGRGK
jgi:uncharacterized YceG family protein